MDALYGSKGQSDRQLHLSRYHSQYFWEEPPPADTCANVTPLLRLRSVLLCGLVLTPCAHVQAAAPPLELERTIPLPK
jgi:hypothetical protein